MPSNTFLKKWDQAFETFEFVAPIYFLIVMVSTVSKA